MSIIHKSFCLAAGAALLALASFAAPSHARAVVTVEELNVAVVKRFLNEVVSGGKIELVDELWAQDLVWKAASLGEVRGIKQYKEGMKAAQGSFKDMRLDIQEVIAQGDKVVVRFTNSGTNIGPFFGKPGTGKFAKWEGIGIYRIKDGRIAEAYFVEDILGMQRQLGNLPGN